MSRLIGIYGASGFGREVLPLIRSQSLSSEVAIAFIDDAPQVNVIAGVKVISYEEFIKHNQRQCVVAIADSKLRQKLESKVMLDGATLLDVKASTAITLDDVEIAKGSILCDNTMITSNVSIGRSFQLNIYSYVAHDCVIGDYVTFGPRVMCNGNVHIEDHAYIGTGAMIKQGTLKKPLIIGEGAVVGMGAVVTKSVPPYSVVFGNPATVIKKLQ